LAMLGMASRASVVVSTFVARKLRTGATIPVTVRTEPQRVHVTVRLPVHVSVRSTRQTRHPANPASGRGASRYRAVMVKQATDRLPDDRAADVVAGVRDDSVKRLIIGALARLERTGHHGHQPNNRTALNLGRLRHATQSGGPWGPTCSRIR